VVKQSGTEPIPMDYDMFENAGGMEDLRHQGRRVSLVTTTATPLLKESATTAWTA